MTTSFSRRSTYRDFVQRVRRHRPSELLPALAETSIRFFEKQDWLVERIRYPWAIGGAAKVSIISGNEHRHTPVTERDVKEICLAYNDLDDPIDFHSNALEESFLAFRVRMNHEQFIHQISEYGEISRMATLFDNIEALDLEILSAKLIEELLGCSIRDFVGAGFVISQGAKMKEGYFDPDWPELWGGTGSIHDEFSMDIVRQVFHDHFLTSFGKIRELSEMLSQEDQRLKKHEFNPLVSKPFVTMPDGRYLAPQVRFAFQRISPATIYYAGLEKLPSDRRNAFTRDIGVAFQDYVGRQLKLIPGATVLPEIVYGNNQKSVDWFVIFPNLVILVEAKSTRLSHLARMGGTRLRDDLKRCIGFAYEQVTRSNDLISDCHPSFEMIPTGPRRIGLVVTLEPYWNANSADIEGLLTKPNISTMVASIRGVERLVDVLSKLGGTEALIEIMDNERYRWELETALPELETEINPILDEAWRRFPFARYQEDLESNT